MRYCQIPWDAITSTQYRCTRSRALGVLHSSRCSTSHGHGGHVERNGLLRNLSSKLCTDILGHSGYIATHLHCFPGKLGSQAQHLCIHQVTRTTELRPMCGVLGDI
jgi:hypothetical protein